MNILVADDHAPTLDALTELLAPMGTITAVSNGFEALAAFETAARTAPFDLLILDVAMPLCDGHTVARQLRADPRFQDLPPIWALHMDWRPVRTHSPFDRLFRKDRVADVVAALRVAA